MGLFYAFVIFSAMLSNVLPQIDLGVAQLSVFRACIILTPVAYLYNAKKNGVNGRNVRMIEANKYSIIFMLIWFGYSSFSILWVKELGSWLKHEFFLGIGCFFVLMFSFSNLKKKDYYQILCGALGAIVINNVIGWQELVFHKYWFASPEKVSFMFEYETFYAIAGFGNLNEYAFFMVFGTIIAICIYYITRNRLYRFFASIIAMSSFVHVLISKSRGCAIGLIMALIIIFYFDTSLKKKVIIVLQCILLSLLFILAFPDVVVALMQKIAVQFSFAVNTSQMNSEAVRVNLIKNGIHFLKDTYGLGVGAGNLEYWQRNFAIYNTREIVNMHNWWMEILVNYGAGVFFFYIMMYLNLMLTFFKYIKRKSDYFVRTLSVMVLAGLVGFIVAGISSSSVFGIEWLWVLWALAISLQAYVAQQ